MQTALKQERKVDATTKLILLPGILNIGWAADNDLQIGEPGISQYHARVVTYFRESFVIDLGSESGILLNGERVMKHSIRPGDVITLGNHHIILKAPDDWLY